MGKSSQGGGRAEEERRRNDDSEEGERREVKEQERGEEGDSPVSSPSSGYNSSGPGGNGDVGGREDVSADRQHEDDTAGGLGKRLRRLDQEERGGLEEQLLIDLSSPLEEGTPPTWDGVKLVMPKSISQEQSRTYNSGAITGGNVVHTQKYESRGEERDSVSRYTVGNHSSHCCHHSSCHSHSHSHRCQLSQKCDQGHQVKTCHKICQSAAAAGLWAGCQSEESQQKQKQPTQQSQKSETRAANERQGSPGIQNSTGSLNRSKKDSITSSNASRRVGQAGPSPNRSTCSPSPSRRPGWTDFSDDEDLNFTRWEKYLNIE